MQPGSAMGSSRVARSVPPTPVGAHFRFLRLSMETAPMITAPTTTVCQ